MNLDGQLSVQDFTTLERVKEFHLPTIGKNDLDALIARMISSVSAQFVRFLGLHALKVERTETYQIRKFDKVLALDGKPVDTTATFTLNYGARPNDLSLYESTDYVVNAGAGSVRMLFTTPHRPGYVKVTYTGGLGTDTAALVSAFPELAFAADKQVSYLISRRQTLGGNITVPAGGGSTSFSGEYNLLKEVQADLSGHRRVA